MKSPIIWVSMMVASLVTLYPSSTYACTCGWSDSLAEKIDHADVIFTGQVISMSTGIEHTLFSKHFVFQVEKSWKGIDGQTVDIYSGSGGGDCGTHFDQSVTYLVYGGFYDEMQQIGTSICSGNRYAANATDDIAFLNNEPTSIPWETYGFVGLALLKIAPLIILSGTIVAGIHFFVGRRSA